MPMGSEEGVALCGSFVVIGDLIITSVIFSELPETYQLTSVYWVIFTVVFIEIVLPFYKIHKDHESAISPKKE